MIPKIIHYCWFGGNPKPLFAQKCIKSWQKNCPDFQIIEWNESNYNFEMAPMYVKQAYQREKWAFVTDYVRLQVVFENGGIYLDTDVELIKSPGELLHCGAYFGFEGTDYINTGLGFGAEKGSQILLELMRDYEEISFIKKDGSLDLTPCPCRNTPVFVRHGLKTDGEKQKLDDGTVILSADYLCPMDNATRISRCSRNTFSIHHFNASWQSEAERNAHDRLAKKRRVKIRIERTLYFPRWLLRNAIGNEKYEKIKKIFKG